MVFRRSSKDHQVTSDLSSAYRRNYREGAATRYICCKTVQLRDRCVFYKELKIWARFICPGVEKIFRHAFSVLVRDGTKQIKNSTCFFLDIHNFLFDLRNLAKCRKVF